MLGRVKTQSMRKIYSTLLIFAAFTLNAQSIRELYQEGVQAYDSGQFDLFKKRMEEIDQKRPNYPAIVYNLACAYSLTGNSEKALKTLNSYILMDASQNLSEDSDLAPLVGLSGFKQILEKQTLLAKDIPVRQVSKWKLQDAHPEAFAYSKKQKAYYIGGVRDGKIWKIEEEEAPEIFASSTQDSWAVMGLAVSPDGKHLWACTSSLPNYLDYDQNLNGYASVLKYDLRNGELVNSHVLKGEHNFGDLVVSNEGDVFISDGTANKVYWINQRTNQLEEFYDLTKSVFNLQGITFDEKQKCLFLSDYIDGIYRLDLSDKKLSKLKVATDDILIKGIDGLYYKDNSLIGLHNGTTPNRVVKYSLDTDECAIKSKEILSQADVLGEPTQGVWVKDEFHYITNSPWGSYDRDNNFSPKADFLIIGAIE